MALATLSIDLEARLARLEGDLSRATSMIDRSTKQWERSFGKIGDQLKGLFAGLSVTATVEALRRVFMATVEGIDRLNDLSDATGASVENLSALENTAARTGSTMDTVAAAIVRMNMKLTEAQKPGSEAELIFKRLGLNAEELRKMDPAKALEATAKALADFADDGNKARFIYALFGKQIQEVGPLLKDLADKGMGLATVTKEQAAEAEKFIHALSRLEKNIVDFARSLMSDALPALNNFLERLAVVRRNMTLMETFKFGAGMFFRGEDFASPQEALDKLNAKLATTRENIAKITSKGKPGQTNFGSENNSRLAVLREEEERLVRLTNLYREMVNTGAGAGRGSVFPGQKYKPSLGAVPDAESKAKAVKEKVGKTVFDPAYLDALKTLDQVDSVKIAALNAQLEALTALSAEFPSNPAIAEGIAKVLKEIEELSPEFKKAQEEKKRLDGLLRDTPTAVYREVLADIDLLRRAMEAGTITAQQYAEAVRNATERLNKGPEQTEVVDEYAKKMRDTIQGALGDTLTSMLQGSFSTIGRMWSNLIQRMVAEAAAAKIMSVLFGAAGGSGGWFGDAMRLLFSANGNAFGRGGLIPFASGGVVMGATPFAFGSGKLGVMGEAGPEAVLPLARGRNGRLGVQSSAGVVIQQTIHVEAGASRNEVMAAASAAKQAAIVEIQDLMRRGRIALA